MTKDNKYCTLNEFLMLCWNENEFFLTISLLTIKMRLISVCRLNLKDCLIVTFVEYLNSTTENVEA